MSNLDFLKDLERSLSKARNKAAQEGNHFRALSDPDYWRRETAKAQDPNARSYDALAPWIAV